MPWLRPLVILGALPLLFSSRGFGDVSQRYERLTELRENVARARGPAAYAELRRVWREWDQGDPAEVEEILHEAAEDAREPAPVRAYAGLLEAYSRRRRGDLDGARAHITHLGYVGKWLAIGPFDNEGKAGLDRAYGPEEDRLEPISLARAYDGKERAVRWRAVPGVSPFGWLDMGVLVRPTAKVCAYAATFVRDPKASQQRGTSGGARTISLWAGSAGAMRVWWNGVEVIRDDKYRDLDAERFAARVALEPGHNRLFVKVCGDEEAPLFTLRVAAADGAPDGSLEIDPDPSHAADTPGALTTGKKGLPPPSKAPMTAVPRAGAPKNLGPAMIGPLPEFERLAKGNDPATLEAFARYLVLTQSDDPTEHRARELARKAASLSPTIPRLLLAGELAENRNQRAVWIERAEALVAKGAKGHASAQERIDTLLARATHTRNGVNWRDAVPYFDRVLALDRDNVPAVLARVELYSEAGLRETALAFLERALARRPKSVALIRAMVAALREQDRTSEADEMQERYASLRFDDPAFTRAHIDLALAQRDAKSAARWIDRLVATNPDAAPSLSYAAHASLLLGDRPAAIALYKRALELAPEDTDTLRALADTYALGGKQDEQLKLLRKVLEIMPQAKDVRDYVAHTEPLRPRPDEVYARPPEEFLKRRAEPNAGQNKRTFVELTVTTVFPNGLASRFHQVVFQPLTDAAAAEAREYAFGFEADTETVQLRGAKVYRANGQVDEAIESGEGPADNPALATYTSARAFYVHFPRLLPGDIVELRYRVEDVAPRNAFADYFGEVTYLQSSEKIGRAEYVLITPKSRTFFFNKPEVPSLEQSVEENATSRIYHFVAKDVPPVEPEQLQPPYAQILGHVHVSTYKTWDDVGRWYWGLVKDQFIADDEVRRRAAEVTKGLTDERAKVRAVYDYVVQKTRYVALEFGIHGFKPYRCAQIFARGFGDCKDKATLIVTMLRELGIPATIVIVRTGHRGDFETEPASLAPFDHAIAYVPSMNLYLDGTAEYTGSLELPAMDRGALALQINEGKPKLVHLPDPPPTESVLARRVEATLTADGGAQLDWRMDVSGVSAGAWRQRYHNASTRKQRLQEDLGGEFSGIEVAQLETSNLEDVEQKVSVRVRGKAPQLARRDESSFSLPVGPREHMVRDFAPLSQRKLDVRLPAQTTTENEWIVHLPAGTRVTTAPKPLDGSSPFGTYKIEVEQAGATLRVKTTLTSTRTRIPAADYAPFRAWCETVDRALGQRVVFSK
jgi:transglutaminase-like putative cysteine protease/tetratricopeptide (TPR) repeat protein